MTSYEVTIGIPVYNIEKYIRRAMDSVLAQTFQSIEFLICDDCGTDASISIVQEFQRTHPRGKDIRIVRQLYNKGLGEGRNRMIDEAKGKYIYFMDGDDAIVEETIELLYENAIRYQAEIVYGSYERVEEYGDEIKKVPFQYSSLQFLKENEFANYVYQKYGRLQANTWNFLIEVGIYRKNHIRYKPINFWEDFTTTMDLPSYITRAVLLPNITYIYYCRYGSLSNFQKRDKILKSEISMTVSAMEEVKRSSARIESKPYFPQRMYKVMMTCFYMVCSILKNEKVIHPSFSKRELRNIMKSPLSFSQTCALRTWKGRNLCLYLLGVLPADISLSFIRFIGKRKGLI